MKNWQEIHLGDIITIKSGFSYKGEFIGVGDAILLGMGCVSNNKKFLNTGARKYGGDFSEKYCIKPGEIVLATRQQSDNLPILGLPAILPFSYHNKKVIVGTNLYKVENNSNFSNDFIYWLLRSPQYYRHISSLSKGTTVRMITKDAVESYKFSCPPLSTQKVIVDILNSLEEKIELNNKINQELETLAQTLFKHWFIDFEFPNENGEPFKSSGGEMVDSELGEIPKGWNVENLCEELKIVYGKNLPTTKLEVSGYDVFGGNGIIGKYHSYLYEDPQVLIACRGAASGKINISNRKSFVTNNSLVLDFTNSPSIQFTYLKYWSLFQDFSKCVSGSAQPQITIDNLKSYLILVPNKNLVQIFTDTLSSTLEKINELNFESNQLEQLRDTLLPKLISGELEINEISN